MNPAALLAAYDKLRSGTLWSSTGRCKGFAVANPGEAAKIDSYVAALAQGQTPALPVLTTLTGQGIVGMLAAMVTQQPALHVGITGSPVEGHALTAAIQ